MARPVVPRLKGRAGREVGARAAPGVKRGSRASERTLALACKAGKRLLSGSAAPLVVVRARRVIQPRRALLLEEAAWTNQRSKEIQKPLHVTAVYAKEVKSLNKIK